MVGSANKRRSHVKNDLSAQRLKREKELCSLRKEKYLDQLRARRRLSNSGSKVGIAINENDNSSSGNYMRAGQISPNGMSSNSDNTSSLYTNSAKFLCNNINSNTLKNAMGDSIDFQGTTSSQALAHYREEDCAPVTTADAAPRLLFGLHSSSINVQSQNMRNVRRLLCSDTPPIEACLPYVPTIVSFLSISRESDLQFEAAWALTNLCVYPAAAAAVYEAGAIPSLSLLLKSDMDNLREQAAWCIGNLSGHSTTYRDSAIAAGALFGICRCLDLDDSSSSTSTSASLSTSSSSSTSYQGTCVFALSQLCRGSPQPPLSALAPSFIYLAHAIQHSSNLNIVIDATWAFVYITRHSNEYMEAVVSLGLIPRLLYLLKTCNVHTLSYPIIYFFGNVLSGEEKHTEFLLNFNILPILAQFLSHKKKLIVKTVLWSLSNIAAGSYSQIQRLITCPDLVPRFISYMSIENLLVLQTEATYVALNIISRAEKLTHSNSNPLFTQARRALIAPLLNHGVIEAFCLNLKAPDTALIMNSLLALATILTLFKIEEISNLFDRVNGVEIIENLQYHENEEIYQRAMQIIQDHFDGEEAKEEEFENGWNSMNNPSRISTSMQSNENLAALSAMGHETFEFGLLAHMKPLIRNITFDNCGSQTSRRSSNRSSSSGRFGPVGGPVSAGSRRVKDVENNFDSMQNSLKTPLKQSINMNLSMSASKGASTSGDGMMLFGL